VEAIQQAVKLGATLLVDDSWGRSIAQKMGLTCIGSIGVSERLHELRLLSLYEVRSAVTRMREGGIRLPIEYLESKGWLDSVKSE
jgi:predicted nucleic acid-binding protein